MNDQREQNEAADGQSELTDGLELRIAKALAYQYFVGLYDGRGMSEEDAAKYARQRAEHSTGWLTEARALLCPY